MRVFPAKPQYQSVRIIIGIQAAREMACAHKIRFQRIPYRLKIAINIFAAERRSLIEAVLRPPNSDQERSDLPRSA